MQPNTVKYLYIYRCPAHLKNHLVLRCLTLYQCRINSSNSTIQYKVGLNNTGVSKKKKLVFIRYLLSHKVFNNHPLFNSHNNF